MIALCFRCRQHKELIVVEDGTKFGYCSECVNWNVPSPEVQAMTFLLETVPFKIGDVVECRTGGVVYDGVGVIEEVSFELEDSGTLACPAFRVRLTKKEVEQDLDGLWYNEVCLTKASESVQSR